MTAMVIIILTSFIIAFSPFSMVAQTIPRCPVEIVGKHATDHLGQKFVTEISQNIRRSDILKLNSYEKPRFQLIIHTLDPLENVPGVNRLRSAIGWVWIIINEEDTQIYVGSSMNVIVEKSISREAEDLVSDIESKWVDLLKKAQRSK